MWSLKVAIQQGVGISFIAESRRGTVCTETLRAALRYSYNVGRCECIVVRRTIHLIQKIVLVQSWYPGFIVGNLDLIHRRLTSY